jgi:DEAD/DEAH box helicase domain-containing protein
MEHVAGGANDTLVFDIETQNFFTDPGVGWNNFGALKISVVGVYSYDQDKYFTYEEDQMEELAELFLKAKTLVGFASNRYDTPVLNLYFRKLKNREALNLWSKDRVDLLEEIERQTGDRISLSRLAEANLGIKKEGHGSEAIGLYERGEMEALKTYCLKDVEITKDIYDLYIKNRALLVPDRDSGEMRRLEFGNASGASPSGHLL